MDGLDYGGADYGEGLTMERARLWRGLDYGGD